MVGFNSAITINEWLCYIKLPYLDDNKVANGMVITSCKIMAAPALNQPNLVISDLLIGKLKGDSINGGEFGAYQENVLAIVSIGKAEGSTTHTDVLINESFLYTKTTDKFYQQIEGDRIYIQKIGTQIDMKLVMQIDYSRILMTADEILAARG